MIHPNTKVEFISREKGYGLVATQFIPKGTITWVQDELDQIFTKEQTANFNPITKLFLDKYCFTNNLGQQILCWDNGKYVNHSFTPSCFSTPYDFEIAIRDIYPGEELTDDYGYLNVEKPFLAIDEGTSRKMVYPNDILTYYKEWDLLIKVNVPNVLVTHQPLKCLIPEATWDEFVQAVKNPMLLKSIQDCYYDRELHLKKIVDF